MAVKGSILGRVVGIVVSVDVSGTLAIIGLSIGFVLNPDKLNKH
jgi:hypothetical protein